MCDPRDKSRVHIRLHQRESDRFLLWKGISVHSCHYVLESAQLFIGSTIATQSPARKRRYLFFKSFCLVIPNSRPIRTGAPVTGEYLESRLGVPTPTALPVRLTRAFCL